MKMRVQTAFEDTCRVALRAGSYGGQATQVGSDGYIALMGFSLLCDSSIYTWS